MFRLNLHILFVILIASHLFAQDDFQKWLKKDMEQYQNYLKAEDKAFSDFLKKDWEAFQATMGVKADTKPKPVSIPVAKEQEKPKIPVGKPIKKVVAIPKPKPKKIPRPKPKPVVTPKANALHVNYKGVDFPVMPGGELHLQLSYPLNNKQIAAAWKTIASSNYNKILTQLDAYRKKMILNDWGFIELIHAYAAVKFRNKPNDARLLSWFLLVKSGYDVKIAYKENTLYLLMPSKETIYENPFVTIDGKKYYFVRFDTKPMDLSGKIYTYAGSYPKAEKTIALSIEYIPILRHKIDTKELRFQFEGKSYRVPVQYDHDVVDFFRNYPQTELKIYFEAPVSTAALNSLYRALKPYLEGKTQLQAVNFLLRFVQKSFEYKTDDQQFGREKYLMPEETIYYPASDCEDRSILFSFLVKNLLQLDVVALDYPGHIATAVHFEAYIPGAHVMFNGKKYVICDPTYINADAGMVMPQYKNVQPKILYF